MRKYPSSPLCAPLLYFFASNVLPPQHDRKLGPFSWPGGSTFVNFNTDESPKEMIGKSAYAFYLTPNIWSKILAGTVVAFQFFLFKLLWEDLGDVQIDGFWQNDRDFFKGLLGATFMLSLRVLPKIGMGMQLLGVGIKTSKTTSKEVWSPLIFVGATSLTVAVGCLLVGMKFALNKRASVYRTIIGATLALNVESIDESMFSFLRYWGSPAWIMWANEEVEKKYGDSSIE